MAWNRGVTSVVRVVAACLISLITAIGSAATDITVNALFDGRAMMNIDGRIQMLRVGQSSAEGVKLLSADAKTAVVEFEGKRQTLSLSRHMDGGFAPTQRRSASVQRDAYNQYRVVGSINGRQVRLLVDTGASVVVINSLEARRMGVDYRLRGTPSRVQTASGVVDSWTVMLDQVEVSGIAVRNVQASVLEGAYPSTALLGMSWLRHMAMREEAGVLYIEER